MTSEARFTLDDVLDATRKIVEEKGGDYIYNPKEHSDHGGCVYAVAGAPSCLVGHVINALDPLAFEGVVDMERKNETSIEVEGLRYQEWLPSDFWTDDAEYAMQFAQHAQDSGETWGDALYAAENMDEDAE